MPNASRPSDAIRATKQPEGQSDDKRVISDTTPDNLWIPGARYAANDEVRSESPFEGTPADLAAIAILGASKAGFQRFDLAPDPVINSTSLQLAAILVRVIKAYPRGSDTAQQYGTFIHLQFADAVRSARLSGIGYADVETTFPEDSAYGAANTIRTDVVLRNADGTVRAIYDVKTGESGLSPARVNQLRAKTGAGPNTPVIELRMDEVLLKAITDSPGIEVRVF
jgi:hypothetical protein